MSKRFCLFAGIVVLFSAASAFAQGGEYAAAGSSSLTEASLPAGAQRVFPNHIPAEINQTLEKLVAQSDGKLRRGETEVLLWTGSDLKNTGAARIVKRLADTHTAGGWRYEAGGTENGITFFSLFKDGAERRAIIGFHGEADGTFVFAWTELHMAGGNQAAPSTPIDPESGNLPGYAFTTPAGWSRQDSAGKIILSKDDDKSIAFLPLTDSTGDLERDADRILWQIHKGFHPWVGNGFEADYGQFEKGKTSQGLEYFRAYRYAVKKGDDGWYPQSRFDAVILLVKVGGKVAVIAGRQPFQSDYARDSTISAVDLILYDLTIKSVNNPYNLKSEILGSWSAASTTVALTYTFNANGSFNKGAVHEFRTRRDRYTDDVTQTSYGMTETYALAGNILTQNYKRTGQVVKHKVRIYQTKYNKDPWQQKLSFLPLANPDGGTIVLRKSE